MSERVRYDDRMSDSDALLWNNERDPMLRSTIPSVMVLDGRARPRALRRRRGALAGEDSAPAPAGGARRRSAPPRRAGSATRTSTSPITVRRVRVAGAGTLRDLLDLAQPIAMQAFDKDRPLWELYQVEGLEEGRSAILIKLHHSVSDGVGLVRMTSSLVERSPEPRPPRPGAPAASLLEEPGPRGAFEETLRALQHRAGANLERTARAAGALRGGAFRALRDPLGAARDARRVAGSLGRLLRPVSEPLSPLLRGRSLAVRFDTLELSLEDLKRAAKAVGGTLNDAFVAAVAGGLRPLPRAPRPAGRRAAHDDADQPARGREGRPGAATSSRRRASRCRSAIADPAERMRRIRELVAAQRAEPALPLFEDVSGRADAPPPRALGAASSARC